ncbi:nucleotide exchange factor GrpE [Sphingomonas ginkgonis]|uniref:Protein GrpE n=1 Tax=Sphingomonas ginkgonis TaxID=2315330 RepID=A0A3R9WSF4_9SPHN|nr:nucleotide exchange factor GrpE [Sphingomonas ginkgonis]RST32192.1 nucleotide exchange factor GrpE [Sphingomonas ginkgonis]
MDEQDLHQEADNIRNVTADVAPELQEHDRVAELEKQLEEANSKALYAAAEMQNVRRRLEKEKLDAAAYANTGFARDLLAVRDHLERALGHVPESTDQNVTNFVSGIQATLRELDSVFSRHGISRIEARGLPLDPNRHQAMMEVPSDQHEAGTIIDEMQSGYMLKERLLRPSLVGVARKP